MRDQIVMKIRCAQEKLLELVVEAQLEHFETIFQFGVSSKTIISCTWPMVIKIARAVAVTAPLNNFEAPSSLVTRTNPSMAFL